MYCVTGANEKLDAVAVPGAKGAITGTLGGAPLSATFTTAPPDPGAAKPRIPSGIAGKYEMAPRSICLGGTFSLAAWCRDTLVRLSSGRRLGPAHGREEDRRLSGPLTCRGKGGTYLTPPTTAVDRRSPPRRRNAVLRLPATRGNARPERPAGWRSSHRYEGSAAAPTPRWPPSSSLCRPVMLAAAGPGSGVARKIGQPPVMGEVVAGIVLGPSVLGAISANLQATVFPVGHPARVRGRGQPRPDLLHVPRRPRARPRPAQGRASQAAAISNASVALPMMLGIAAALPLYKLVGPNKKFVAFALFMGVAMSITAFPVLARILAERRMLKRPVGALALACAAIDDVTAWFLIALATTIAVSGSFGDVAQDDRRGDGLHARDGVRRPAGPRPDGDRVRRGRTRPERVARGDLRRRADVGLRHRDDQHRGDLRRLHHGHGDAAPRRLTEDVTRRIEDFVVVLLLPMFFVYTGLRTNIGLLDRPELWLITPALIAIAIVGKLAGAAIAARVSGFDWRASAVIGTLMNTRGLTELIVLNLALDAGAISERAVRALVLMALVTTFMAGRC